MATLNFSQLSDAPRGEAFEALIRLIGERLGMAVQWTGRGPDGGRDLIFVETQSGPISSRPIRWLVSCKDNSEGNRSVMERDVGSILDKVNQYSCDGFLLATTTTVSAGLKETLDQLGEDKIQTKVWDRFEITKMLLSPPFTDLLLQFFPDHKRLEAAAQLDAAREVVEASLPRFIAGEVRERLVSYSDRLALLSGNNVWPHDADQQTIIDEMKSSATSPFKMKEAVEKSKNLHFDAFISFADALIRNFPREATIFLKQVAQSSDNAGVIFNAIEMLRENDDFSFGDELEITRKYDRGTLFELYQEMVTDALYDTGTWDWRLPREIADDVEIIEIEVNELEIFGGDSVCVTARVDLNVRAFEPPVDRRLSFAIDAHFEQDGLEIDAMGAM